MIYSIFQFLNLLSWSSKKPRRHRPYGRSTAAFAQGSERAVGPPKADAPTRKENRNLDLLTEQSGISNSGILNNVVLRHSCEGGPTSGRCGLDHRIGHLFYVLCLKLAQCYPMARTTRHWSVSLSPNFRRFRLLRRPAPVFPQPAEVSSLGLEPALHPRKSANRVYGSTLGHT